MNERQIISGFQRIESVWPDAEISNTLDIMRIPRVRLPSKFNLPSTPILIEIPKHSDYIPPRAYVDRRLRLWGKKSQHLPESCTEDKFLRAGWVWMCMDIEWHKCFDLDDFLLACLHFLETLDE